MKSIDITALGFEDVSINESVNTNGGVIPWPIIFEVLGHITEVTIGIAAAVLIYESMNEEVEEYYGGELDAAICYGN